MDHHYDMIVIGTGPAGEAAAMKSAKSRLKVAAVEQFRRVGGGATHWGTIPSKSLRAAIYHTSIIHRSPLLKRINLLPRFSFPELMRTTTHIVEEQTALRESFYERNQVRLVHGHARFIDPHTVLVEEERDAKETLTADRIIIASGSRPYRPADIDFTHPRIFDSDTILTMPFTPQSMLIYGAGVIGSEYASMFNLMQLDVTLVNTRDELLAFMDKEVTAALAYHFTESGVRMFHSEEYQKVTGDQDGVVMETKSGKRLRADCLLYCNGRSGNVDQLGLETIGVRANSRGQIPVTPNLQVVRNGPAPAEGRPTGQAAIVGDPKHMPYAAEGAEGSAEPPHYAHIYGAGDIIGSPALASASYDQGRFAATHAITGQADFQLITQIPTGIYTTPEISSIGKTEEQLTEEKVPYEIGKSHFKELARAQISGLDVGFLKLLFHRQTLELLGVHCFGESASEIIHIGQAVMAQPAPHNTIRFFVTNTFNYPTMAEAYRVAALNGLNHVF